MSLFGSYVGYTITKHLFKVSISAYCEYVSIKTKTQIEIYTPWNFLKMYVCICPNSLYMYKIEKSIRRLYTGSGVCHQGCRKRGKLLFIVSPTIQFSIFNHIKIEVF